ncbi:MAG: glycosyltransferase family 4 protein [Desulfurococcaceae archaeon]
MEQKTFVIAIVPVSIAGSSGDSVNERQLLEAISRYVERIIVFSITPIQKFRKSVELKRCKCTVVELPFIPYFGPLYMIFYSFIIMPIVYLLNALYRIDFIYARSTFPALGLILSRKLAKKTLVKYTSFIEDELRMQGKFLTFIKICCSMIDKIVLSNCKKILVPSHLWFHQLTKRRFIARPYSDYVVVPPGVNIDKIMQIAGSPLPRNSATKIRVGFLGTITWWQGADILAKACIILKTRVPNIKLVLIGHGEKKQIDLIKEICELKGLEYEITGYLSHEDALKHLRELDVLVLPSRRISTTELNIPIKVIEAWALGVPVIVTRHDVFLKHGVRNFEDVIFCEPHPSSVAGAILTLLNEPALREKLKVNGFRLALRFDYNKIAKNLLKAAQ